MKKSILLLLILLSCLPVSAQKTIQYIVFSVAGGVTKENVIIEPKQIIKSTDKITIPRDAQLSLFDEAGKRLYSIGEPGTHHVGAVVAKLHPSVKQLTSNYIKYIKDHLFGNNKKYSEKTVIGSASTTGFRGEEEDVLFMKSLLGKFNFSDSQVLSKVFEQDSEIISDYNLMFDLVSYRDQSTLQENPKIRNPYYLRVTNGDNVPLFVNVLAIDKEGSSYLILKPHEQYGFSNYLVPPNGTVSFLDQHFNYKGNQKVCFILFASEIPVDYRIVEAYKDVAVSPSHEMNTGIKIQVITPEVRQ